MPAARCIGLFFGAERQALKVGEREEACQALPGGRFILDLTVCKWVLLIFNSLITV